jgi:hypothetical protein
VDDWKQINGDPSLNYDPGRGQVVAPWLAWGPYLWIDGLNPRSDGMICTSADLKKDSVHPSLSGRQKVVDQLNAFLKIDKTAHMVFGQSYPPSSLLAFYPPRLAIFHLLSVQQLPVAPS